MHAALFAGAGESMMSGNNLNRLVPMPLAHSICLEVVPVQRKHPSGA